MNKESQVARFITQRIEASGLLQKDIAEQVGFTTPNMITMIKQGRSRLPLDKIGPMAKTLEVDPIQLLKLCMEEYQPNTWNAIAPLMETAMTPDEQQLLATLRAWTGGPFLAAMSDDSKRHFENFMASLRIQTAIQ